MLHSFVQDVEFNKLVRGQVEVDLVRLMLEFAADSDSTVNRKSCLAQLAAWGSSAAQSIEALGQRPSTHDKLAAISRVLYTEAGLRGNRDEYYAPANSHLPSVIQQKIGIPISLAIVYMAVAARAGVSVYGVPTPGHFMLACRSEDQTWYIDPFDGGELMDYSACRSRIEGMLDAPAALDDICFRRATAVEIAVRVLRNLKAAYAMADRWQDALPVQERLVLLLPCEPSEHRDLGLIYLRTSAAHQALEVLESYASNCTAEDEATIEPYLRTARRMVAELN